MVGSTLGLWLRLNQDKTSVWSVHIYWKTSVSPVCVLCRCVFVRVCMCARVCASDTQVNLHYKYQSGLRTNKGAVLSDVFI